ncbi:hypothetical protein GQ43DRAFT_443541 [Delitschia confertaspora ATCC 74209]|uniref:DUF8021 domain-containing protein n=1 Tax=Delitschia confertaspora ATCC 74209 TaxID=1513339 RepID=A0A9P4JK92_9PLEO|nr:hypothetical protein GQ43DRAFT_443541 [Delitschia confertaspora ATCC 74209]
MLPLLRTFFFFLSTALSAPIADPACSKSLLRSITDNYVAAQTSGKLTYLSNSTSSIAYYENDKKVDITKGVLSTAQKLDHVRSQHDTTLCATYTELIITNSAHPYVLGTQMRIDVATSSISKIETVITQKGDWLFNATGTLNWASKENWSPIPESARNTRTVIQAAADAYCDIFNNKSVVVPWGRPCARLEGGSYTGKGTADDRCDVGIPSGVSLSNRRYVIDEEYGTVGVMLSFVGSADVHEFRVEGGKIRFVHTLTDTGK